MQDGFGYLEMVALGCLAGFRDQLSPRMAV